MLTPVSSQLSTADRDILFYLAFFCVSYLSVGEELSFVELFVYVYE